MSAASLEEVAVDREADVRRRMRDLPDPLSMLRAVVSRAPTRDAFVHLRDAGDLAPSCYTYAAAANAAGRFAAALVTSGIGPDDAVAIVAPSIPEMMLAMIGAASVAIAFPLNLMLSAEAMAGQLRLAGARAVVTLGAHPAMPLDRVVAEAVRLAGIERVIEIEAGHGPSPALAACCPHPVSWLDFLAQTEPNQARPVHGERAAFLFHTGGTTGSPKLAELGLAGTMASLHASAIGIGWREDDRVFQLLPFFHVGGAVVAGMSLFSSGATLMNGGIMGARDPEIVASLWPIAERLGASVVGLVPPTWSLVAAQGPLASRWPALRGLITGATSMAPELAQRIAALTGLPMTQVLGMTELSGCGASQPMDGRVHPPAVGYLKPLVEARLVPIAEGGPAELQVRGPMLFRGYRTADGLVGSPGLGWHATGDLGEFLPDGQLRLVGRAKDVIIRSGHNIDPLMIEDVVCRHPAIVMAAAVGMPDAYAGELPVVYAVRRTDTEVSEEALASFVSERIEEAPARPRRIIFVDALPLTQVGKVARFSLRQMATEMRAGELLAGIEGITGLRCEDRAAREIIVSWLVDAAAPAREAAQAVLAPLGIRLIHTLMPPKE